MKHLTHITIKTTVMPTDPDGLPLSGDALNTLVANAVAAHGIPAALIHWLDAPHSAGDRATLEYSAPAGGYDIVTTYTAEIE